MKIKGEKESALQLATIEETGVEADKDKDTKIEAEKEETPKTVDAEDEARVKAEKEALDALMFFAEEEDTP